MIKIVTIALLSCASYAKLEAFNNVLNGQAPLTQEVLSSLYSEYKNEFKNHEIETFLASRGLDRRAIFESSVRGIIAHNTDRQS